MDRPSHTPGVAASPLPVAATAWRVAGIVLLLAGLDLALASSASLWDRDEPRFARAGVEMLLGGDYLVPRFNGELRPDKPILIYWLMNAPLRLLGPTALAVRLPSILAMSAAALLTFLIGAKLFDRRVGLSGMLIFATMLMVVYMGSAATADATLLAFMLLALWALIAALLDARAGRWWHFVLLAVGLGGAQLAKGPVGLAVPLLTVAGAAWFGRSGDGQPHALPALRRGRLWVGVVLAALASVGLFLAWAIPANNATGGQFARLGLGRHVFERMLKPQEGHGGAGLPGYLATLPVYLPVLIFATFPWVVHLPGAVSGLLLRHVGDRRQRAVLWGWIVPTFVMMSLVATKLPHYILPVLPACAIAIAATLDAHQRGRLGEKDRAWLRGGVFFFTPIAVIGLAAFLVGPWVMQLESRRIEGFVWGGLLAALPLAAMLLVVLRAQLREQVDRVNRALVVAAPLTLVLLAAFVLPALEAVKPSPGMAAAVHAYARRLGQASVPVWTCGHHEPSLTFYLNAPPGQRVQRLQGEAHELRDWAQAASPGVMVITRARLDRLAADDDAKAALGRLDELARMPLINYSAAGQRQEVIVLGRGAGLVGEAADEHR